MSSSRSSPENLRSAEEDEESGVEAPTPPAVSSLGRTLGRSVGHIFTRESVDGDLETDPMRTSLHAGPLVSPSSASASERDSSVLKRVRYLKSGGSKVRSNHPLLSDTQLGLLRNTEVVVTPGGSAVRRRPPGTHIAVLPGNMLPGSVHSPTPSGTRTVKVHRSPSARDPASSPSVQGGGGIDHVRTGQWGRRSQNQLSVSTQSNTDHRPPKSSPGLVGLVSTHYPQRVSASHDSPESDEASSASHADTSVVAFHTRLSGEQEGSDSGGTQGTVEDTTTSTAVPSKYMPPSETMEVRDSFHSTTWVDSSDSAGTGRHAISDSDPAPDGDDSESQPDDDASMVTIDGPDGAVLQLSKASSDLSEEEANDGEDHASVPGGVDASAPAEPENADIKDKDMTVIEDFTGNKQQNAIARSDADGVGTVVVPPEVHVDTTASPTPSAAASHQGACPLCANQLRPDQADLLPAMAGSSGNPATFEACRRTLFQLLSGSVASEGDSQLSGLELSGRRPPELKITKIRDSRRNLPVAPFSPPNRGIVGFGWDGQLLDGPASPLVGPPSLRSKNGDGDDAGGDTATDVRISGFPSQVDALLKFRTQLEAKGGDESTDDSEVDVASEDALVSPGRSVKASMSEYLNIMDFKDDDDQEEQALKAPEAFFIHPQSRYYIGWNVFLILLVVYTAFEVPFTIGFEYEHYGFLEIFSYFLEVCFIVDLCVNFFVGYYDDQRNLIFERKKTARHYLKTWFLLDLVGSIPWDLLGLITGADGAGFLSIFRACKLPRMFRLARLTTMIRIRHHRYLNELVRMAKLMFILFAIIHIVACFWFFLGVNQSESVLGSWVFAEGLVDGNSNRVASLSEAYITSLYWAMTSVTTVGYGDIVPVTQSEKVFASFVLMLGAIMYAAVVGYVGLVVSNLNLESQRHSTQVLKVSDYMRQRGVPLKLRQRILDHVEAEFERMQGYNEQEILRSLPVDLRGEIALMLHRRLLGRSNLFSNVPKVFLRAVATRLRSAIVLADTVITRRNEPGEVMYFIVEGSVVLLREGQAYSVLKDGAYVGLSALLKGMYTATAKAHTYCQLALLHRHDFERISAFYPGFKEIIVCQANLRRRQTATEIIRKGKDKF